MRQYFDAVEAVSGLDQCKARLLRLQKRLDHVPPHWEVKSAKRWVINELRRLGDDLKISERSLQIYSARYRRRRLNEP